MQITTITLYKTTLTSSSNYVLPRLYLLSYLSNCTKTSLSGTDYQVRNIDLDLTLKIPFNGIETRQYNYANLQVKNNDTYTTYFFFITDFKMVSDAICQLTLHMDTLNTFAAMITDFDNNYTDATHITRTHLPRFTYASMAKVRKGTSTTLIRQLDRYNEGFSPILYNKDEYQFSITSDPWYLCYWNADSTDESVKVEAIPSTPQTLKYSSGVGTYTALGNSSTTLYILNPGDTATISNVTYSATSNYLVIGRYENSWHVFYASAAGTARQFDSLTRNAVIETNENCTMQIKTSLTIAATFYMKVSFFDYKGWRSWSDTYKSSYIEDNYEEWYPTSLTTVTLPSYNASAMKGTNLIKVIECPYAPFDLEYDRSNVMYLPSGWAYDASTAHLYLTDPTNAFKHINVGNIPLDKFFEVKVEKDYNFATFHGIEPTNESKLFTSPFFQPTLTYDSFKLPIRLEDFQAVDDGAPSITVNYYQSNCSSDLIFEAIPDFEYKWTDRFERYLVSSRNNEATTFSNNYYDYMRSDYNWDRKTQTINNINNWVGTAASIGSTVGAAALSGGNLFAMANVPGMITSAATSLTSAITKTIAGENSIQQNIEKSKLSTNSINGSDNLSLFRIYQGNEVDLFCNQASGPTTDALLRLFHYTGYGCDVYERPSRNRYFFQYLACEPDWVYDKVKSFGIKVNELEDIEAKMKVGITVFYTSQIEKALDSENWEYGLVA